MTSSYSGNPAASPRDRLRFLLGDTGPDQWFMSDGEIDYWLAAEPNFRRALARAARKLAFDFALAADMEVGGLRIEYTRRAEQMHKLALEYEKQAGIILAPPAAPLAGGQSRAAKRAARQDPDLVQPNFTVRLHDNPRLSWPFFAPRPSDTEPHDPI